MGFSLKEKGRPAIDAETCVGCGACAIASRDCGLYATESEAETKYPASKISCKISTGPLYQWNKAFLMPTDWLISRHSFHAPRLWITTGRLNS